MKRIFEVPAFCSCFLSLLLVVFSVDAMAAQTGIDGVGKELSRSADLLQFRSNGHTMGFAPLRMYIVGRGYCLIESFAGTDGVTPVRITGEEVDYPDLWPGISLRYGTGKDGIAESIYQIAPGANVDDIRLTYNSEVEVRGDGSLALSSAEQKGLFTMSPPRAWQSVGGEKVAVAVTYFQHDDRTIGFQVSGYDRSLPLTIDPVYQWHTFYGSAAEDYGYDIAVDGSGNVYVTGFSTASWNSNAGGLAIGPIHGFSGGYDIMVLKLNSMGRYQWHTFFGSADFDRGNGLAVSRAGDVYVTGRSMATWNGPNPILPDLPIHGHSGGQDIVILKLDGDGKYQWHTFYGSAGYEEGFNIEADVDGNVYAAGIGGNTWNGPAGQAPLHGYSNDYDAVVMKLNDSGEYQWHTFYGSDAYDFVDGMAVDGSGNVYLTGISNDIWFGPHYALPKNTFNGDKDIFVLKLSSNGEHQWHTFHGSDSPGYDAGTGAAVDNNGVYISGYSDSTWNGPGGEIPRNGHTGNRDIVVLKLNHDGAYQFHTFYGSTDGTNDVANGIKSDGKGRLYVVAKSDAAWNGPGGENPLNTYSGDADIVILSLTGSGLYQWHTFFGSALRDGSTGIALDSSGNVHVTGYSDAAWTGPGGEGSVNDYNGNVDILILKMTGADFPWPLFRPALDNGNQQP